MSDALFFQVRWFQQQHEKKRKKRDFMPSSFSFDYPTFFDEFGPRPRQTTYHRQRNRGVPLQNLFTDPLFKEQWYLVSGPFDFTSLEPRPKRTLRDETLSLLGCVLDTTGFQSSRSTVQPRLSNPFSLNFSSIPLSRRCRNNNEIKEENRGIYFL